MPAALELHPQPLGIHIRHIPHAHVKTITSSGYTTDVRDLLMYKYKFG